jgi:pimeloyl-ACP methyl ester carboxylesterase
MEVFVKCREIGLLVFAIVILALLVVVVPGYSRYEGALFDMYVSNPDTNNGYPLEEILVPTLVVHAQDDPLTDYEKAKSMAVRNPGARLVTIESGGHPLLDLEE